MDERLKFVTRLSYFEKAARFCARCTMGLTVLLV